MRNMSFMLTTEAMRNKSKTVTRRIGWEFLKPGDRVMAVEKGMGLKKGEKVNRLGIIEIVSVRRESLYRLTIDKDYADQEAIKEGFPHMTGNQFAVVFCNYHRVSIDYAPNRIEFKHVGEIT